MTVRTMSLVLGLSLLATSVALAQEKSAPKEFNGLPLLYADSFDSGKATRWEPTDASAWKVEKQDNNFVYHLLKRRSKFEPPVRQPYNRSLLKGINVGSFVLDVKLQSTIPDYNHRDLCLFFGYQDDSHLHYVHFGKKADPYANQIFIVNDKPRLKISITTSKGTNWNDAWHHTRIVRDAKSGKIEVYFDDMKTPVMTAVDKTFTWGRVGVGSFDDTGNFDQIRLYGEKVDPPKAAGK
jgi:hypothetical protein